MLNSPNVRIVLLLVGCASSVVWTKLSPATGFLTLVVWLSTPRSELGKERRARLFALSSCALLASIGFVRFVLAEAIPGVIAGGQAAATKQAISFVRTIVNAQDHLRQAPRVDPDGDGIGSALGFSALAGLAPARDGQWLKPAPLYLREDQLLDTPDGPAVDNGAYLYKICLPVEGGGFSANPSQARVDDERAERDYRIYAWPRNFGPGGPLETIYADAYERILITGPDDSGRPRFHGTSHTPPCDIAVDEGWPAWKDKQPRTTLPGDRR